MKELPIKTQSIIPRMDGIAKDIKKLQKLGALAENEFCDERNYMGLSEIALTTLISFFPQLKTSSSIRKNSDWKWNEQYGFA